MPRIQPYRRHLKYTEPNLPTTRVLIRLMTFKGEAVTYRPYRAFYGKDKLDVLRHLTDSHTFEVLKTGPAKEMKYEEKLLNVLDEKLS